MSNNQVGAVYQQIISDVIEASRVDFEEGGVEEGMLEELRKGWQRKLSQQQLAVFPWDPKPEPTPAPATAATGTPQPAVSAPEPTPPAPANGPSYNQAQIPPQAPGLTMPVPDVQQTHNESAMKPEPGVKIEPGLEGASILSQQSTHAVQQRVIQQLQSQYGERAAASINKLKEQPNGAQSHNQQRSANQPVAQNYPGQYQGHHQQQYRPNLSTNVQQQRVAVANGQRPAQSQLDGADATDDHVGVLMRRGPAGDVELGRVEIDRMLHAQIAANAKAMEGGGLMVPLKRSKRGKAAAVDRKLAHAGPSQYDGPDEDLRDDSDDENAINSDLDDPDDNPEEEDEDDDSGQIMLCMYDKVQRVKNKWKCVLKDGVLSVNGKDWVFHKATGEYEW